MKHKSLKEFLETRKIHLLPHQLKIAKLLMDIPLRGGRSFIINIMKEYDDKAG